MFCCFTDIVSSTWCMLLEIFLDKIILEYDVIKLCWLNEIVKLIDSEQ